MVRVRVGGRVRARAAEGGRQHLLPRRHVAVVLGGEGLVRVRVRVRVRVGLGLGIRLGLAARALSSADSLAASANFCEEAASLFSSSRRTWQG